MDPEDPTRAVARPPGPFDETGPVPLDRAHPRPGSEGGLRARPEVPRRGARVAGFEVLGELGRGGFGVVLHARDPGTGREVALKLMLDAAGGAAQARFTREGELLARLDHPGVVRVHAAGVDQGRPYLVVELVEGARSLDEGARGAPLTEKVRLVRDAARALGHAHARGVVHRDVKPANLLVDREGRVRVTDFGLAVAADLERLTQTGYVVGTPLYLAPEQLRSTGAPLLPATDVWGLGVVLFELVAGRPPWPPCGLADLLVRLSTHAAPSLRSAAPEAPAALDAVVARALARDPAARFKDGAALADALDRALAPPAGRGPTRGLLAVTLGLVAGCLAVGVAASVAPGPPAAAAPDLAPAPERAPRASVGAPPARDAPRARWSEGLDPEAKAQVFRAALDALDAEVAAGRPPGPGERAAAIETLAELDRRWRTPAAFSKDLLEALYRLVWAHALWLRLDPGHVVPEARAQTLRDLAVLLVGRPDLGRVGAELARILPRDLNGYVLHADAHTVDPGNADGPLLRRGLALAEGGPPETWDLLARVLAGWLYRRANGGHAAARDELVRLAEACGDRPQTAPRVVTQVRALAARHATPESARRLLLASEAAVTTLEDRVALTHGWWRLADATELGVADMHDARGRAFTSSWAVIDDLLAEPEPRDHLLDPIAATLVDRLPPDDALTILERCLARRPAAFAGLALRRVRLLAERGASDDALARPLADLARALDQALLAPRLPEGARAWVRAGASIVRAVRARPSGHAAAAREWLFAWAEPAQVRLLDRR